ncbi:hypothetical protein [Ilumatobacter sp.]|uniref:hypothetical protein n=1 Tax=Ilumatobacter sp. TaxID=1967498 RepID=UPI003B51DC45
MTAALVSTAIVIANVLGASMALPQTLRLVRTRDTHGVSSAWAGVSISMNGWWLAYGLTNDLWGLVPVSAVAAALYAIIAVVLVRVGGRTALRSLSAGAVGIGVVPAAFLAVGGWSVAGVAIGVCYGLQLAPAVVATCRTADLGGVAPATWVLAWAESVIWLAYGVFVVDAALVVGGVSGALMATVILVRLAVTGHRPLELCRPSPRHV